MIYITIDTLHTAINFVHTQQVYNMYFDIISFLAIWVSFCTHWENPLLTPENSCLNFHGDIFRFLEGRTQGQWIKNEAFPGAGS